MTNYFDVDEKSILLEECTTFQRIGRNKEEIANNHLRLDSFVKEEDKVKAREFLDLLEEGDQFYTWSWYPAPFCERGGICIFRNNLPKFAYMLWLS